MLLWVLPKFKPREAPKDEPKAVLVCLPPPNHNDFSTATGEPRKRPDRYFPASSVPSEPVAYPKTPTWSIFPVLPLPKFLPYTPALICRTVEVLTATVVPSNSTSP